MITPSFSLTATERVLPKLALDFTTASLDSRVTFTRTTDATHPATYTNSSGYVTAATNNQPRFDYDPITLQCKGLLIEESRLNLLQYSADFTNWSKVRSTVTADAAISPDNTLSADKLIEDTSSGTHLVAQLVTTTAGATYTASAYLKAAERNEFLLVLDDNTSNFAQIAIVNGVGTVSSGGTATSVSGSVQSVGNGWYRVTITCAIPVSTTARFRIYPMSGGTSNYVGNGTSGIYIWGAQLEAGAFATSYIPTTSAALTRNADVATMTGTNFSSWWTATTGSTTVSVIPKTTFGVKPVFGMDDNTADNIINLRGNAANPELYIKTTTDQAQIDAGTIVANTAYKLSGAWNTNSCAAAQNGTSVVEDTSATIPTVTQARIGSDGTNYANAWIQKISYWPQRLINPEVQAFSK